MRMLSGVLVSPGLVAALPGGAGSPCAAQILPLLPGTCGGTPTSYPTFRLGMPRSEVALSQASCSECSICIFDEGFNGNGMFLWRM